MRESVLDLLSKELRIVSMNSQKKMIGGSNSLSEIIISYTPPSFDLSGMFGGGSNGSYGDDYGGGGSGSSAGDTSNIDPSADGNNHINDPDGMLNDIKTYLGSVIADLEKLIESGNTNPLIKKQLDTYKELQNTLDKMESDVNQKYRIDKLEDNKDKKLDAHITYDETTGEIVLSMESSEGKGIDLIAHELTHIKQIMDGDIWVEAGELSGVDIYDEVDAYTKQLIIRDGILSGNYDLNNVRVPGGDFKVTPEIIKSYDPDAYGDLPNKVIKQ